MNLSQHQLAAYQADTLSFASGVHVHFEHFINYCIEKFQSVICSERVNGASLVSVVMYEAAKN